MKSDPIKMSETLDQFAGGYFSRGESPEEIQGLLNVACTAYNIACLPVEYLDVLQNIEYVIVFTHREHPDMADAAVMRALEALIDRYKGEKAGRPRRDWRPSEVERRLEECLFALCEWRMGRAELLDASALAEQQTMKPITVDETLKCLKKILKSVNRWNKEGGSRGYLDFVGHYFP